MQEDRSTAIMICLAAAVLLAARCCSAQQQQQTSMVITIEDACRAAAMRQAGVSYEHCVRSLSSEAAAADLEKLAALATRMAVEHAASTEAKMEGLSEVEESPHARARLHHCLHLYSAAADVLRDALDNIRARVYAKAAQQLAAALGASDSCEDAWKGEERVPVAGHDAEYARMALVALGLTTGITN